MSLKTACRLSFSPEMKQRSNSWVLVTGGLGYIGSHVAVELCCRGFNVITVDQLGRGAHTHRVTEGMKRALYECCPDEQDRGELHFAYADLAHEKLQIPRTCDVIIHLAALKSVAESTAHPLKYYDNNLKCLLTVLECARMWRNKPHLIFSSSATVYGSPNNPGGELTEAHPLNPVNAYGQSKLMCEQILASLCQPEAAASSPVGNVISLRYFNPVGAHPTGHIGEYCEQPTNLMPILCEAAAGQRDVVYVFSGRGTQSPHSPVRDYLHIMDLVEAHIAAMMYCLKGEQAAPSSSQFLPINLGRGEGVSVLDMISEMELATGIPIPTQIAPRRPGDVWAMYASCQRAHEVLGWRATRSVREMCASAWKFYRKLMSES